MLHVAFALLIAALLLFCYNSHQNGRLTTETQRTQRKPRVAGANEMKTPPNEFTPNEFTPNEGVTDALRTYASRPHIAQSYDTYFAGLGLFRFDTEILEMLLDPPGRLLDVGCGTGRHLVHFARKGFEVTGVDLSTHMIEIARRKLAEARCSGKLVRTTFCDLSMLPDSSFDYAICMFSTLGMVRGRQNRLKALREIHRVLADGATFIMHAHNRMQAIWIKGRRLQLLKSYIAAAFGRGEPGDAMIDNYRGVPNMFLHTYSARELAAEIEESGLKMRKLMCLDSSRTGILRENFVSRLIANGFIAVARK